MSPTSYLCSIPHLVEVGGIEPPLDTFAFAVVVSYLITPYCSRQFTYVCNTLPYDHICPSAVVATYTYCLVEVGGVEPPLDTFAFAAVVSYLITPYCSRQFTYVFGDTDTTCFLLAVWLLSRHLIKLLVLLLSTPSFVYLIT